MNFINNHNDNIIISKIITIFNKFKNFLLDFLDIKTVNKDIIQDTYPKVEDFSLRREYNQLDITVDNNSLKNFLFYTGLILIIGGITLITYNN
jgi:hypothetical protein